MSGTFDHIEVYPEVDLRCSVCGAAGDPQWVNVSFNPTVRRFLLDHMRCPNGPHIMTTDEWDTHPSAPPVRPAPNDPSRYSERGLAPKRRRWWSK